MNLDHVLELGDPGLREISTAVQDVRAAEHRAGTESLLSTLDTFRRQNGFGRAMAAPQIGIPKRFIGLALDGKRFVIANPEIVWRSEDTFTMWDDCMSFPSLLVRVRRHRSISVQYTDESGELRRWQKLDLATSELLQHEIDHLDGVLAVDHALDRDAVITRRTYERYRARFDAQVDYTIASPTAGDRPFSQ